MEYNTSQTKLVNGEYGRHIQKMIESAIEIEDSNLRNQQARAIVRAMSYFSAGSKDTEDYWNKLWDQLFVISNFRLDVDSPFPKPQPEIEKHPKPLKYPKRDIRYRPYGVLIEDIINKVVTEKDSENKEYTVLDIANHLKRQYLNWNRDSVNDALIHEHLETLSHGKLKVQKNTNLHSTRAILSDIEAEKILNAPPKPERKKKRDNNNAAVANPTNNKNKKHNQPNNQLKHNQPKQNLHQHQQKVNQPKTNHLNANTNPNNKN